MVGGELMMSTELDATGTCILAVQRSPLHATPRLSRWRWLGACGCLPRLGNTVAMPDTVVPLGVSVVIDVGVGEGQIVVCGWR